MSLTAKLVELGKGVPAPWQAEPDGSLTLQFVVAQRRAFLSHKRLIYRARLRVREDTGEVRFFEMLKEVSSGLGSGGDELSPGFGFRVESYRVGPQGRTSTLHEQSILFGKVYQYHFDFGAIRQAVEAETASVGYRFSLQLNQGAV